MQLQAPTYFSKTWEILQNKLQVDDQEESSMGIIQVTS